MYNGNGQRVQKKEGGIQPGATAMEYLRKQKCQVQNYFRNSVIQEVCMIVQQGCTIWMPAIMIRQTGDF